MHLAAFMARRIFALAITCLVASFVVYAALYLAPGSPISFLLNGHPAPPAVIHSVEAQYHLKDPLLVGYAHWLGGLLQGDLGRSLITRQSVWSLLQPRIVNSVMLIAYAGLVIAFVGVGAGVLAGLRPRRLGPIVITTATACMAVPPFVVAVLLVTVFGVDLGWFPVLGAGSGFGDRLYHLTMPALALALATVAYVARITRAAVTAELQREHVETARARGIRERQVVRRHVLRNAAIPITTVVGISVASLIAGDAVVETAFGINGIGAYLIQSVVQKDFAVVQAITLILVVVFVVVNMIVDIGYALIDPRVGAHQERG
jgi:peptide/nickel transport system permease protein